MSLLFLISLLVVVFICSNKVEGAESYIGWKLARLDILNETQLWEASQLDLDVWNVGGVLKSGKNDVRVDDHGIISLYNISVATELLISDLDNEISRERQELGLEPEFGTWNEFKWYTLYRTYTEIVDKLLAISYDYPSVASYSNVGITFEDRAIPLLKITGTAAGPKQKVLVVSGLQAREWLGPATVAYIAQRLASLYGSDETVTSLLDNAEVHIIPLANPDGYVYSWETARLWKKNRRPNADGSFGVDLGRNWNGTQWVARCASSSPSSDSYCGTNPFSEVETSSIRDYVHANGPFSGAVEYGSYSQQVLRPFSFSSVPPQSEPILKTIGDEWASILYRQNEIKYTSNSASAVSNVTGNARDYFFSYPNIPLSFTVELRDTGASYGFIVPVSKILPTCEENFPGFTYFLQAVHNYA